VSETTVRGKVHFGVLAVVLILIAIFAAFRFALYTLERVYGITVPYPEITITLTWAIIALIGVWVLGHTIQTTTAPLVGQRAASNTSKIVQIVLALGILIATLANLHIDITGYLVSLGVTAVVVGFAAQTTIGNLIAGMLVLISKPFRKGDYIKVNIVGGPIEGTIDEISFLRSRIFTNDGISISVPNTVMLATPISNFTVYERRPIILNIALNRNVPVETFREKVDTAMLRNGVSEGETRLYMKGFDQDSTSVELWVQVATRNFLKERSLIVQRIANLCEKEKVQLKKIELQS
jgi:small-conductance mechanosensitive channel